MGSCNIAEANVDLQGLGRDGGPDKSRCRRPNADRRAVLGACLPARDRRLDEAQAKQRSGVPARLDEAFRQELLVGCGNRVREAPNSAAKARVEGSWSRGL